MSIVISQPLSMFTQPNFNHIHFITYILIEHLRISVPILGHALPKAQVNVEIMVGVKTTSSVGVTTKSQPGSTPTPQNYHHVHFITYSSGDTPHFFHKNSQSCDIPPTTP